MSHFAHRLIAWQRRCGRRDLPWQGRDAYRVWLSEIMLQQTQVETVIPYYRRFLARFPDMASLAAAPLDEVMTLWSGLGYYARARNLHKTARIAVGQHHGRFPQSVDDIAALPGIGRSTAAAIAVFAFGARAAILDGNVRRVLCRVFGVEGYPGDKAVETRLWTLAEALLPDENVDIYIQAQMDLGALICKRAKPLCADCPVAAQCIALREARWRDLPAGRPKKAVVRREARFAVIVGENTVLLERRPPAGIWGGLLALPEIPPDVEDLAQWAGRNLGVRVSKAENLPAHVHAFTHFTLTLKPVLMRARPGSNFAGEAAGFGWHSLAALDEMALPAPIRRILESCVEKG